MEMSLEDSRQPARPSTSKISTNTEADDTINANDEPATNNLLQPLKLKILITISANQHLLN